MGTAEELLGWEVFYASLTQSRLLNLPLASPSSPTSQPQKGPRETLEEGGMGMRSAPRQPSPFPRRGWEEAAERVPATLEVCPLLRGQTTGSRAGLQPGWGEVVSALKLLSVWPSGPLPNSRFKQQPRALPSR